jgi:hypothetical protein
LTSIVTDFKSIRRKLDRQEQKAEFEAKNPKVDTGMYGWPYMTPFMRAVSDGRIVVGADGGSSSAAGRLSGGSCESVRLATVDLPSFPLKSLAHPEWPYTGTPHEWPKFKI